MNVRIKFFQVFFRIVVLKYLAKCSGKHERWNTSLVKLQQQYTSNLPKKDFTTVLFIFLKSFRKIYFFQNMIMPLLLQCNWQPLQKQCFPSVFPLVNYNSEKLFIVLCVKNSIIYNTVYFFIGK